MRLEAGCSKMPVVARVQHVQDDDAATRLLFTQHPYSLCITIL